jgi:abortive infection bacteriophage resistance protein
MQFVKPPLSQQQLINLLISRGLPLTDSGDLALARQALVRIGYFRLTGFMLPFVIGGGGGNRHQFRPGATISKIVDLHDFDAALRHHCLEGLGQIEIAMRASICDHLCRQYGAHWPLDSSAFAKDYSANLEALAKAVDFDPATGEPKTKRGDSHQFLTRYYVKYKTPAMPPGWMVQECASFRTWAFLFDALHSQDQKQVSDAWQYPSNKRIDHAVLGDWFHSLSILRNRCAHHGRITGKQFPFAPNVPRDPSVAALFTGNRRDLRTLLVVMAILIRSIDPKSRWLQKLFMYLDWQRGIDLAAASGFIPWGAGDWRDDPLWGF